MRWHFGYLAAILGGFILTAAPNWTGRLPLSGLPLAILVALWLAGRLAMLTVPSPLWALVIDAAFLVALAAAVWREIVGGRNLRNLPVAVLISLFAVANMLFHLGGWWPGPGIGERLALSVAALLIGLIGGRIVPSFTRNWMARLGLESLPVPFGRFDKLVPVVTGFGLAAWVFAPAGGVVGALLAAGLLHLARLARWRGRYTAREPLMLVLHLGYLWLDASLLLMGLAALASALISTSTALHALSAGAIGTMTLAMMTWASLGHTGRALEAGPAPTAIYGLVSLGALLRIAAPYTGDLYLPTLAAEGCCGSGAFALFVLAYGPLLLKPGAGRI